MNRFYAIALGALMLGAQASAADLTHPGLFTSAEVNFEYALAGMCLPYVAENRSEVMRTGWGVATIGWGDQGLFTSTGLKPHLVGNAGKINVGGGVRNGQRVCMIEALQGDAALYRTVLQRAVAASATRFALARSPYPAHDYAARDLYCVVDPASGIFILASFAAAGDRRHHVALITVDQGGPRSARCDHEGVPDPVAPPQPQL